MGHNNLMIGEYIDSYFPAIDGVIICVQNYAKWLNQDHCNCYVATADGPKGYEDTDPFTVIRYNSVPVPNRYPYRFGLPQLDSAFIAEQHILQPDLVHTHSPFIAGREAYRIAKQRNIPIIASFHTKYYEEALQMTNSKFLSKHIVKMIVDFYHSVDYVWTMNQSTAKTLRSYGYKKDIEIMPNGTDFLEPCNKFEACAEIDQRFGLDQDDRIVLYVGQHIIQKNLMMLLDATADCINRGIKMKLLMVGEGSALETLKNHAHALNLSDHVIFTGSIQDRELLSKIYVRSELFAFPSLFDTCGLVISEAAAAECPSIVIKNSNAAEQSIDGYNAYWSKNTAEDFADTIQNALQDEAKRNQIAHNAKATIGKPWREIIATVYDRYEEIIASHPSKKRA